MKFNFEVTFYGTTSYTVEADTYEDALAQVQEIADPFDVTSWEYEIEDE